MSESTRNRIFFTATACTMLAGFFTGWSDPNDALFTIGAAVGVPSAVAMMLTMGD